MDFFDDDPWGEEPDWAKDDENFISSNNNNNNNNNTNSNNYYESGTDGAIIGAQHVLMLVDCHSTMFVPLSSSSFHNNVNSSIVSSSSTTTNTISSENITTNTISSSNNNDNNTTNNMINDPITPVDVSLNVIQHVCKQRIRTVVTHKTGKRDGVGLILYNTATTNTKLKQKQQHQNNTKRIINNNNNNNDKINHDNDDSSVYSTDYKDYDKKKKDDDDDENNDDNDDDDDDHSSLSSTSSTDTHNNISTVHVLLPLEPPGIKQVKTIRSCLSEDPNNTSTITTTTTSSSKQQQQRKRRIRDLQDEFQSQQPQNKNDDDENSNNNNNTNTNSGIIPLQYALEECLRMFQNSKCVKQGTATRTNNNNTIDTKSIWIFTCNDDVLGYRTNTKILLQNVARDIKEEGIQIVVWPLPTKIYYDDNTNNNDNNNNDDYSNSPFFDYNNFFHSITTWNPFPNGLLLPKLSISTTTRTPPESNTNSDTPSSSSATNNCNFQTILADSIEDWLEELQNDWKKVRRVSCCPMILPMYDNYNDNNNTIIKTEDDNNNNNHTNNEEMNIDKNDIITTDDTKKTSSEAHIMIDWYKCISSAKKPTKVKIDQQTRRETIKVRQLLDDTGNIIATYKKSQASNNSSNSNSQQNHQQQQQRTIRQYTEFGGERIILSSYDLYQLKRQANGYPIVNESNNNNNNNNNIEEKPMYSFLKIIGFQSNNDSSSSIPLHHTINSSSYFIYPSLDETLNENEIYSKSKTTKPVSIVKGSRNAFIQLHTSMIQKNVIAIGEVLHRIHYTSRLVAIYPIQEEFYNDNDENENKNEEEVNMDNIDNTTTKQQKQPPGMMVITLPFEDDIRELEPDAAMKELLLLPPKRSTTATASDTSPDTNPIPKPTTTISCDTVMTTTETTTTAAAAAAATTSTTSAAIKEEYSNDNNYNVSMNDNDDDYNNNNNFTRRSSSTANSTSYIASEEIVQATMELIQQQHLIGMEIGESFENVPLNKFYNYLEAVALEDEYDPNNDDEYMNNDIKVDDETVLNVARNEIEKLIKLLPSQEEEDNEKVKKDNNNKAIKRKRELIIDDSGIDWEYLYQTNTLMNCKVIDLKKYLKSIGEPVSGNKSILVDRITEYLSRQQHHEHQQKATKVKMEI